MGYQQHHHFPQSHPERQGPRRPVDRPARSWWHSPLFGYPLAVAFAGTALLVPWIEEHMLGVKDYFVGSLFLLAVLLVGWLWGFGPALLALVLSAFALDYWIIPPVGGLTFFLWPDIVSFGSFLLLQLVVLGLITVQRKNRQRLLLAHQAEVRHAEELAESNAQISSILESITDGFMHLDRVWRYRYINEQMKKIIKPKGEALPGQCIWDVVPELLGTPFERYYREAMEKQQVIHFEALHPVGQRWLDVHVYPIKDGITVYLSDMTERKRAEEALRESEIRFRALVEANIIGIITCASDGLLSEANDAFLSLVGATRQDLDTREVNWKRMTPPEYWKQDEQAIQEIQERGTFAPYEKEYLTRDGGRVPVLVGGTRLRMEDPEYLHMCFILDLTARKESERQKDLILGMTSHELKTPLAALKGTFQLLRRRTKRLLTTTDPLPPEVSAFLIDLSERLTASARQVDVQTHLINDLLDVSRITAGTLKLEREPCDLVALVRETVEDLRVMAPERSLVLVDIPQQLSANVLADQARISQVITNYVTNALRYSSPDQPVHIGVAIQEPTVRVWVRDWGPGLTEEAQKELWQRFHQIKGVPAIGGSGKGLGLGLSICQTLIAQHQGEVGVDSTPGEGSTFWFRLPLER